MEVEEELKLKDLIPSDSGTSSYRFIIDIVPNIKH